jgi:hypothetical protein
MAFQYVSAGGNYEDLASGRVLYNQKGATAFPVRLASEIFLRCVSLLQKDGLNGPFALYDPLCGGAYMLTALGFLHGESIKQIYASDIDENAVQLAERNFSLLYEAGISNRIRQLQQMITEYHKPSHTEALQSAFRLQKRTAELDWSKEPVCFSADAGAKNSPDKISEPIDIVITDLPYGDIVQWKSSSWKPADPSFDHGTGNHPVFDSVHAVEPGKEFGLGQDTPASGREVQHMLDNLLKVLHPKAAVAIVSRNKLGAVPSGYARAMHFKHGKRNISILRPNLV